MNEPFIPDKLKAGAISELRRQLADSQRDHAKAITRIAQLTRENEQIKQRFEQSICGRIANFFNRY